MIILRLIRYDNGFLGGTPSAEARYKETTKYLPSWNQGQSEPVAEEKRCNFETGERPAGPD